MLCCWVEDPNSEAFKLHLPRIFDFLWLAEDGMKMQVQKQYHPYSRSTNHNNNKKKKKKKRKRKMKNIPNDSMCLFTSSMCTLKFQLFFTADIVNIFQGYNGSQLWDTAFCVQAIISTDLVEEYGPTLRKAHAYLKKSQVLSSLIGIYLELSNLQIM